MNWFEVDHKGLAKLLERKGKAFALFELVQNAWDENATRVDVTLERIPGSRNARLVVRDDNPTGFANLSHAFTLFADSAKKGEVCKRGRYNCGEKMVLALCQEASIATTTGTVVFNAAGRSSRRSKTDSGSIFTGILKMTAEEIQECAQAMSTLLPPAGKVTTYNGEVLAPRVPIASFEAVLPTVIADEEGYLRRTERKAVVNVHEPLPGEEASLFELGLPVVPTGDRWHVDVQIKVPLNLDRDNVPPAYLAKVRALVVAHMAERLEAADANSSWVREALQKAGDLVPNEAVRKLAELRFGEKRVAFDPSDPEANNIAVSRGYTLVYGAQLSKPEWEAVRRSNAVLPAGQVTPSPRPYSQDGKDLRLLPEAEWSRCIRAVVDYAKRIAPSLIGREISVRVANQVSWPFAATYGGGQLTLNLGRLGHRWFAGPLEAINDLLLHELGHEACNCHLSEDYYKALTRLGARLVRLALEQPETFRLQREVQCYTSPAVENEAVTQAHDAAPAAALV
ncbi:ATP-binding protein [Rubrivivax gelatinosus]|uniref:ATP-binding protein n=1 Tax=Rubrivivax gelatinosus TaxID=28068 RepID=UPI0002FA0344|nr:ATP-binding protein [Rubrivivax gelatinosus]MBG6083079.1 hypothetical protein [Rubrivivax gelatinosus]